LDDVGAKLPAALPLRGSEAADGLPLYTVKAVARGRDGVFLPTGISWTVERSFAWISRYRRLNTIFDRTKEHLIAFIEIAFVSILARRLKRLAIDELSA
jgi:hypothetical protein